jgi:hypothetical protein
MVVFGSRQNIGEILMNELETIAVRAGQQVVCVRPAFGIEGEVDGSRLPTR